VPFSGEALELQTVEDSTLEVEELSLGEEVADSLGKMECELQQVERRSVSNRERRKRREDSPAIPQATSSVSRKQEERRRLNLEPW